MNRPLFRETIPYRPMMDERELPSRRRSIWTMTTSLMAAASGILNEPPVAPPRPRPTHPAVREIHKNAWLKRQTSVEKKGTPFTKKAEKFWVVFCVHDDSEALLEFYTEPKMATIHKPQSSISINSCLHVSPSIVAGQDNEYQFAVTLQSEVIRLVAANWEQMIEWVESLQGKLREMNILSPKDNLYSKLPETKVGGVASTRDPNSPLPPPPTNPSANQARTSNQNSSRSAEHSNRRNVDSSITNPTASTRNLGVNSHRMEDSHTPSILSSASVSSSRLSVNGNSSLSSSSSSSSNNHDRDHSRSNNSQIELRSDSHHRARSNNSSQIILHSSALVGDSNFQDLSNGANGSQHASKRKQQVSCKVNVDINPGRRTGHHQQRQQQNGSTSSSSSAANTTVVVIGNGDARIHTNEHSNRPEIRNGEHTTSVLLHSNNAVPTEVPEGTLIQLDEPSHHDNQSNGSGGTSCVSRVAVNCTKVPKLKPRPHIQSISLAAISTNVDGEVLVNIEPAGGVGGNETGASSAKSKKPGKSCSSENIYEHIYIPDRPPPLDRPMNGAKCNNGNNHLHKKVRSQNNESGDGANRSHPQRSPEDESPSSAREFHARRLMNGGSSSQRSSSLGRIEVPSVSNRSTEPTAAEARRNNGNRNHSTPGETPRSIGNSTFFANNASSHTPAQLQGSPLDALIGSRNGEYRLRRDEYLIREGETNGSNDNQSNNHISSQSSNDINSQSFVQVLPLKEQQVRHLQMEIDHPGGVRIILRKKDCLSSIAFVDYLGAVWIAGWKQQQYPVLYYGLHVGDQIMKVAGVNVQTSVEASRAIKMVSSMQVEFIIRRLPYGKVFALKRSRDGEPLGLIAEGGSGEISEVLPEGLAARYGLPPKGLSLDGRSPCNWYLTEVNNRPLSLMSKENEVKDRLNAVGKEISILVQPADLVKHLRKSLKSYKGFKDYVVG